MYVHSNSIVFLSKFDLCVQNRNARCEIRDTQKQQQQLSICVSLDNKLDAQCSIHRFIVWKRPNERIYVDDVTLNAAMSFVLLEFWNRCLAVRSPGFHSKCVQSGEAISLWNKCPISIFGNSLAIPLLKYRNRRMCDSLSIERRVIKKFWKCPVLLHHREFYR